MKLNVSKELNALRQMTKRREAESFGDGRPLRRRAAYGKDANIAEFAGKTRVPGRRNPGTQS